MGEHRRRAKRPAQDVQDQRMREEAQVPAEISVRQADDAHTYTQTERGNAVSQHRRRAQQAEMPLEDTKPESVKIPRLSYMEDPDEKVQAARLGRAAADGKKNLKKPGKKVARPSLAKKEFKGERLQKIAHVSVRAGKTAARGVGGLLLLAVMAAGSGIKKLKGTLEQPGEKVASGNKNHRDAKTLETQSADSQEYVIEMVRPQDYRGRGQAHAQMHARKKTVHTKKAKMRTEQILVLAFACVALFSAYQIGAILLRSLRTNRLNDNLAKQRAALMEENSLPDEEKNTFFDEQGALMTQTQMPGTPEPLPVSLMAQNLQAAENTPEPMRTPDVVKTTKYHQYGGDALPEMAALREKNRDLVAWIQIPDVLDLPVVYRDNDYYLTHDFNKQKNASGTLFLDENHPFKEKTQNLLLHGHNMKDGTMFGRLAQYLYDDTYLRNHPFIYFDTLWKKEQYVIVAVLNVSLDPKNENFFNYFTHDTFASDAEFRTYIRQLQIRSAYAIPIDVEPGDALLTLSTCLDDDRLVIVCRRLRADETRSQLREMIRISNRQ